MGRTKEQWEIQHRHELAFVRAEAAYEAVPDAMRESHAKLSYLQLAVGELTRRATATESKWQEDVVVRVWCVGLLNCE
jgi:hypothetical protein